VTAVSGPLLIADEVEREYHMGPEAVRVLRGVSLTVNAGESIALIGASGTGKSTLLHLLGTLDRPTAGRVLFDGQDVAGWSDAALARLRRTEIGFVFQFYNLLGEMTAAALHEVGLGDRRGHRPGELSGGEQQRVAVARALVGRPRVILADEPTGNLDPKTSEVIWDLFLRLQAERQLAFVIATHNHELARKADRGYRLVDGRAVAWP
jgi:lipoprotein-releasing system ATP-binding protein